MWIGRMSEKKNGEIKSSGFRLYLQERSYIFSYLGSILLVTGILLLVPFIPYLWYREGGPGGITPWTFLLPALFSILVGFLAQRKIPVKAPNVRDAMVITALGWLLIGLIGGVPFMIGLKKSFIDAFFESVSGLTTTGITVFEGLDSMPRSILFWRSFIQWLGGLGILTFFLAVSFRGNSVASSLFGAEGHKISTSRPVPGIFNTIRILWGIYILFTVASFVAFFAGGQTIFDAVNHSLTCISTGGFSTHDASIAFYANNNYPHATFMEYAFIIFMLAGGTNFLIHYRVLSGKIKSLINDFEMRWYWSVVFGAVILIMLDHLLHFPLEIQDTFKNAEKLFRTTLFQVASLVTSTGYATKDINNAFFPALSKQIIIILMVIGGCVGSTAGGIKMIRIGTLAHMFRTQIFRVVAPRSAVSPIIIRGQIIPDTEIERISALFFSWIALIFLGAGITALFSDLNAWQSISGMTSALGNMGPFYFSVHKMASLHWVIKFTYSLGMLAGRLEILPIAIILSKSTWK